MRSSALLRAQVEAKVEAALEKRVAAPFAWRAERPAETLRTGIAALDGLTGGLPRGALVEVCGPAWSGRTTLLLAVLAAATQQGEACALVDASDALDPASAVAAGVDLGRLLWVRCSPQFRVSSFEFREKQVSRRAFAAQPLAQDDKQNGNGSYRRLERALRAADLILQAGGFGVVALDLGDIASGAARRVPLASWFRFRRAVEGTSTVLLLVEQEEMTLDRAEPGTIAGSSAALALRLRGRDAPAATVSLCHAELLEGVEMNVEVVRAPGRKKPAHSAAGFAARAAWAG